MNSTSDLANKQCKPCEGGVPPLTQAEADKLMNQLKGWQRFDHLIGKTYHFKNYYETMAFVNAIAWMSHREDHHPELNTPPTRSMVCLRTISSAPRKWTLYSIFERSVTRSSDSGFRSPLFGSP